MGVSLEMASVEVLQRSVGSRWRSYNFFRNEHVVERSCPVTARQPSGVQNVRDHQAAWRSDVIAESTHLI